MPVTPSNLLVTAGALAGLGLAPSAYRRGRAVGFCRYSPKSRIRAELHKQKILRNR